MSWEPDSEIERLVTITITGRRDAMAQRQATEKKRLDAELASRGVLNSGGRLQGHYDIDSASFDEFAQGTIDDVLALFSDIHGNVPVEAAPWIKDKLSGTFDGLARGIVAAGQDLARQMRVNWKPDEPAALF